MAPFMNVGYSRLGVTAFIVLLLGIGCTVSASGNATPWEEARRAGVDLRAVGQEPGWILEIRDGEHLDLLTDYGQTKVWTPVSEPQVDPQRERIVMYHTRTRALDLTVTVKDRVCHDAMNGREFPVTVIVELNGREYRGCGRKL